MTSKYLSPAEESARFNEILTQVNAGCKLKDAIYGLERNYNGRDFNDEQDRYLYLAECRNKILKKKGPL